MTIRYGPKQTKVSCQGDIAVQPFYPEDCDGVAWLALSEGPPGEPGRDIRGEVDEGPRLLGDMEGVLIGATDYRSLDAIIRSLVALRDRLQYGKQESPLERLNRQALEDIQDQEDKHMLDAMEAAAGSIENS